MKTSFVYLLRSLKDGKCYVGWTTDLKRRLEEHNAGLTTSTKTRRPFELVYYETYSCPELAKSRERVLKRNPNMLYHFMKRAFSNELGTKAAKEVVGDPTTTFKKRGFSKLLAPEDSKEVVG